MKIQKVCSVKHQELIKFNLNKGFLGLVFRGEERAYTWNISHNARDNTTNRISSHSDGINGINHLLRILRIWAPNNITLYLYY